MRFQERDGEIIDFIQFVGDGVASRRHLRDVFWTDARTDRAMDRRLSKLKEAGYIHWPTKIHYRTKSVPQGEQVVWLGPKGAWRIAHKLGSYLKYPDELTETWKRNIEKELRGLGVRWLREPRWIQLKHDIEAIDFRLAVEIALSGMPNLSLEEWRLESAFRADYDTVEYRVLGGDGKVRRGRKGVQPDGYFVIVNRERLEAGLPPRIRYFLEIDEGTSDLTRIGKNKFLPGGQSYINSAAYKDRFGDNSGRWLIITTGEVRMRNLISHAIKFVGSESRLFLFTTKEEWRNKNVLSSAIWWQVDNTDPQPLLNKG